MRKIDMVELTLADDTEVRITPSNFKSFHISDISLAFMMDQGFFHRFYDAGTIKFCLEDNYVYKDIATGKVINVFDALMKSDIDEVILHYENHVFVYYPRFNNKGKGVNDYQVGVRGKHLWVMIGGTRKERRKFLRESMMEEEKDS